MSDETYDETDTLCRFSFVDAPIRGQWVRIEYVLAESNSNKSYPDFIQTLLGQMYAAVAMFADSLKFNGAVALQSQGDGALSRSLAECRSQRFLRGIAHLNESHEQPAVDDLRAWLGNGRLALSLIPDQLSQQPYQGLVQLQHANLATNLEHYFATSEQLRTRIFFASSALTTTSATTGLLLQRLPDPDNAVEVALDAADDAWQTLTTLAATVTDKELARLDAKTLLHRLFHQHPIQIHPARHLRFKCTCTRAKTDQTLQVFGHEELQDILAEDGVIAVDCEFCGAKYRYDAINIATLQHYIGASGAPGPEH